MDAVLNYTTGILVTLEEGAAITGRWKPLDMARSLMDRPGDLPQPPHLESLRTS